MKLNEKDYMDIATRIQEGCHDMEYKKDGETLFLEYELDFEGYFEDATGGFVRTAKYLFISGCEAYDEDGNRVPCDLDEAKLERLVA